MEHCAYQYIYKAGDQLTTKQLSDRYSGHLPKLVAVSRGFHGNREMMTFSTGQVLRLQELRLQERALVHDDKKNTLSVPLDYTHLFIVKSHPDQTLTLRQVVEKHSLPVEVKFADPNLHFDPPCTLTFLRIIKVYKEPYFIANTTSDGEILDEVIPIPLYLKRVTFCPVVGIRGQGTPGKELMRRLIHPQSLDRVDFSKDHSDKEMILLSGKPMKANDDIYKNIEANLYISVESSRVTRRQIPPTPLEAPQHKTDTTKMTTSTDERKLSSSPLPKRRQGDQPKPSKHYESMYQFLVTPQSHKTDTTSNDSHKQPSSPLPKRRQGDQPKPSQHHECYQFLPGLQAHKTDKTASSNDGRKIPPSSSPLPQKRQVDQPKGTAVATSHDGNHPLLSRPQAHKTNKTATSNDGHKIPPSSPLPKKRQSRQPEVTAVATSHDGNHPLLSRPQAHKTDKTASSNDGHKIPPSSPLPKKRQGRQPEVTAVATSHDGNHPLLSRPQAHKTNKTATSNDGHKIPPSSPLPKKRQGRQPEVTAEATSHDGNHPLLSRPQAQKTATSTGELRPPPSSPLPKKRQGDQSKPSSSTPHDGDHPLLSQPGYVHRTLFTPAVSNTRRPSLPLPTQASGSHTSNHPPSTTQEPGTHACNHPPPNTQGPGTHACDHPPPTTQGPRTHTSNHPPPTTQGPGTHTSNHPPPTTHGPGTHTCNHPPPTTHGPGTHTCNHPPPTTHGPGTHTCIQPPPRTHTCNHAPPIKQASPEGRRPSLPQLQPYKSATPPPERRRIAPLLEKQPSKDSKSTKPGGLRIPPQLPGKQQSKTSSPTSPETPPYDYPPSNRPCILPPSFQRPDKRHDANSRPKTPVSDKGEGKHLDPRSNPFDYPRPATRVDPSQNPTYDYPRSTPVTAATSSHYDYPRSSAPTSTEHVSDTGMIPQLPSRQHKKTQQHHQPTPTTPVLFESEREGFHAVAKPKGPKQQPNPRYPAKAQDDTPVLSETEDDTDSDSYVDMDDCNIDTYVIVSRDLLDDEMTQKELKAGAGGNIPESHKSSKKEGGTKMEKGRNPLLKFLPKSESVPRMSAALTSELKNTLNQRKMSVDSCGERPRETQPESSKIREEKKNQIESQPKTPPWKMQLKPASKPGNVSQQKGISQILPPTLSKKPRTGSVPTKSMTGQPHAAASGGTSSTETTTTTIRPPKKAPLPVPVTHGQPATKALAEPQSAKLDTPLVVPKLQREENSEISANLEARVGAQVQKAESPDNPATTTIASQQEKSSETPAKLETSVAVPNHKQEEDLENSATTMLAPLQEKYEGPQKANRDTVLYKNLAEVVSDADILPDQTVPSSTRVRGQGKTPGAPSTVVKAEQSSEALPAQNLGTPDKDSAGKVLAEPGYVNQREMAVVGPTSKKNDVAGVPIPPLSNPPPLLPPSRTLLEETPTKQELETVGRNPAQQETVKVNPAQQEAGKQNTAQPRQETVKDNPAQQGLMPLEMMSIADVKSVLSRLNMSKFHDKFEELQVDGKLLSKLDDDVLKEDFNMSRTDRIKLSSFISEGHLPC
ncbi:hypothetical protein V1264_009296 [Littorina saxatilis]|uniref:SAM domain-containing protein n=1 Tax=Littorina saxatilis TaxID=31220 RepID=A0AAN9G1N3_9CAEN